jgi:hypothetical protein
MNSFNPAIVVIAFNRPQSLERLLSSIDKSPYPNDEVPLCICIDYQDSDANRAVVQMAEDFVWNFGPKEVIRQSENLGLKAHVLKCGDLTERFGSIIMLEDDLYVSPAFYDYTLQALNFYGEDDQIAGISLYTHRINVTGGLPFEAINDDSDGYFLQVAASWGQSWTWSQWNGFRTWLSNNPKISDDAKMSSYIKNWPDSSWLKHYMHYLVETDRYFVYPRLGLSTNFSDAGTHINKGVTFFQVPLILGVKKFKFLDFQKSNCKYDIFFELQPEATAKLNPSLQSLDFEVNLYGLKKANQILKKHVIVTGDYSLAVRKFNLALKPIHANVVLNLEGKGISIVETIRYGSRPSGSRKERRFLFEYFSRAISFTEKTTNILDIMVLKVKSILSLNNNKP